MWVRGDSLASGTGTTRTRPPRAFRGDWFVGGDLISIDQDGYVTHRGRADDAIKVKGKWLSPQEVESCLLEHEAVKECAVVAFEDDDGLLKPTAFVVASAATSRKPSCNSTSSIGSNRTNTRGEWYSSIELPQTHLGKVDRGALKRLAGP